MGIIYMKQWLDANQRTRILSTDKWYFDFALQILKLIESSGLFNKQENKSASEAAILLSLYLQDAIAQQGGWKAFQELYFHLYKSYLPFYCLTDTYLPDEINQEDVAFILWNLKTSSLLPEPHSQSLFNPLDTELLSLSESIYHLMDSHFEEAPINQQPSPEDWVMDLDALEIEATPLPEITSNTPIKKEVERCLKYSQGSPLLYFATYQELSHFLVQTLKWENNPNYLLPDLADKKEFIIYANAKGMLIAYGVAAYFRDDRNPIYDPQRAKEEGYKIFCEAASCPFDLLKFGMFKGLLPDLQLPFPKGKELLHKNWDFIARYYLGEYYEGE